MSEDGMVATPAGAPPASPDPKLPATVAEADATELRERARELMAQLFERPQPV